MASKSLLLLGLLFAIILVISSDVVSARNDPAGVAETQGTQVDGHGHGHHGHHGHHEEAESETTKSTDVKEDRHYKHKCKHWPHC